MAANLLPVMLGLVAGAQDWSKVWTSVLESCSDVSCVRGRVDQALDRALNMTSISLAPGVTLVPAQPPGTTLQHRRVESTVDKAIRLFTNSDVNIQLGKMGEGRGRRKKYAEYYYAAALVAAFLIPLKLQALAVVAGTALVMAKVALALSGSAILKKLPYQDYHRRTDIADPYYVYSDQHR